MQAGNSDFSNGAIEQSFHCSTGSFRIPTDNCGIDSFMHAVAITEDAGFSYLLLEPDIGFQLQPETGFQQGAENCTHATDHSVMTGREYGHMELDIGLVEMLIVVH